MRIWKTPGRRLAFALLAVLACEWAGAQAQPGIKGSGSKERHETGNGIGMTLRWIPPGKFTMGSPASETNRDDDEAQVPVTLSKGFWMGKYEVTHGEYEAEMGKNPSYFEKSGKRAPVERVIWEDAMKFCRKLTQRERKAGKLPEDWVYTLPTEAQWEYACRAGTTGAYAGDLDAMGWYSENSGRKTQVVGRKKANGWGLHDMHGNVLEWCLDGYVARLPGGLDPVETTNTANRVYRGGSWGNHAMHCRSAKRLWWKPDNRLKYIGFRVVAVQSR